MKKIYQSMIVILLIILINPFVKNYLFATDTINSWDFLPIGANYMDSNNFVVEDLAEYTYVTALNPFRIKPATTYTLSSSNYYDDLLNDYDFNFYDQNKNLITNVLITYQSQTNNNMEYSVTFETPSDAYYIEFSFVIFHPVQKSPSYVDIDYYFCFFEGVQYPGIQNTPVPYGGPNIDYMPVLSGASGYYITNIDAPISVASIQAGLVAIDDIDGDITENIIVQEDNYTNFSNVLGTYSVTFSVTDSSNNTTEFTIYITIVDTTSPNIYGQSYFIASPIELLSINYLKTHLSVTDNYDTDLLIILEEDNYTENFDVIGEYTIIFSAEDNSSNKTFYTITVSVEDDIAPEIIGNDIYTKGNNVYLPISEIITLYSAHDNVDGDITHKIKIDEDNYSINPNRVGTWTIILSVTDAASNTTTKTIYVEVIDKTGPVFMIDRKIVMIDLQNNTIEVKDIIAILQRTMTINENVIVEVVYDDYTVNKNTLGSYKVILECDGKNMELELQVINGFHEDIDEPIDSVIELTFFEKILSFFVNIWSKIKNFFKKN